MPEEQLDFSYLQDWTYYKNAGGQLSYSQWFAQGRPGATTGQIRWPWETVAGENFIAPWTQQVLTPTGYAQPTRPSPVQGLVDQVTKPEEPKPEDTGIPGLAARWEVRSEGGYDWKVGLDKNGNVVSYDFIGASPGAGGTAGAYPAYPEPTGGAPTDQFGRRATWDADNAEWRFPPDWGTDPATQMGGYMSAYQQEQMRLQQEQMQMSQLQQELMIDWYREQQRGQLEAQKQTQLANLRANPASWLEYASLAGETPAIQPWMLPLMPQQYAGLQAGAQLPGWQAGGESLQGLPELTKPSAQYMGRLSPTALQQYGGYERARTGALPEDVQWRLWSQAPPGGTSQGLSYMR